MHSKSKVGFSEVACLWRHVCKQAGYILGFMVMAVTDKPKSQLKKLFLVKWNGNLGNSFAYSEMNLPCL